MSVSELVFNWPNILVIAVGLGLTLWNYKKYENTKSRSLLNCLPGVWTSLGILGTFVSICWSLYNIGGDVNSYENAENIGKTVAEISANSAQNIEIKELIRKLVPAFTTSIIGLIGALAVTLHAKYKFAREESLESDKLGKVSPEESIHKIAEYAKQTAEYAKGIAEYAKKQDDRWGRIDDYYKEVVHYLWLINCHGSIDNETLREIKDKLVSQITEIDRRMYEIEQKQVHNSGEK